MKKILTILLSLLSCLNSYGQADSTKRIEITGLIDSNSVLLRWVPSSYTSWARANQFGYTVYRIPLFKKDGSIVNNPDTLKLGIVMPQPLNTWENYADSSTFAIAAEALYGKEFEVTTSSGSFFDLVNKSREQENRFTIGLICADKSFTVACMMGLGFTDSTANPGFAYAYRVVANYTDSTGIHEDGYVYIDLKSENFIPRPFGISYQVAKGQVTILVPYEPFKGIYSNFELERSTDSINYTTVVGKNFYSVSTTEDDPKYHVYTDSLKYETPKYYYRIRGRTHFDTFGPYSEIIMVNIMPIINVKPWITTIKETYEGLSISWEFDSTGTKNLKGFMVYHSPNQRGPFSPLVNEIIDKYSRTTYLHKPADYAYYSVAAIDQSNRPYFSTPRLFQANDSIPPFAPTGLKGEFDSTGTVKLKWNYGLEDDLLCYQLLYTANPNKEYSLLSNNFIYDSTFTTTFPLNLLSSQLHFRVVALDTRYNASPASEPIMLVKPDTIPPSPPVIFAESDTLGYVTVKIAPSRSKDIRNHAVYSSSLDNKSTPVEIFKGIIVSDTLIVIKNHQYSCDLYCVAFDISGRKAVSNKIRLFNNNMDEKSISNFKAFPNIDEGIIELWWTPVKGDVMIYRKMDGLSFNLIKTINGGVGYFKDNNVIYGSHYTYKFIFNENNRLFTSVLDVLLK